MFPRCYLENFADNLDVSYTIFKNHNPKIIIDSVSYHKDELLIIFDCPKDSKGTKLILFQHGGIMSNLSLRMIFWHMN